MLDSPLPDRADRGMVGRRHGLGTRRSSPSCVPPRVTPRTPGCSGLDVAEGGFDRDVLSIVIHDANTIGGVGHLAEHTGVPGPSHIN